MNFRTAHNLMQHMRRKRVFLIFVMCAYVTSMFSYLIPAFTPTAQAAAGIPKIINFQGKLTAVSDGTNVANGTYAFEFKMYDALTSGTLLWTETFDQPSGACSKLTVTNGVFNAKLGSCASLASIDMTDDSRYISVNFAPTGTSYDGEMSPRKQLTAAAYAFNANNVVGNGKIDISNTTGPQATIGYDGSNKLQLSVASNGFNTLTANGAGAGYALMGGNVGIGTTTVSAKLHSLATTEQLRLGYDASNFSSFTVSSGGNLTLAPSGGTLNVTGIQTISSILQVGSATATTYSRLGTGTTNHSLDAANDLLVTDDFEVDDDAFFDGDITVAAAATFNGTITANTDSDFVFADGENLTVTSTSSSDLSSVAIGVTQTDDNGANDDAVGLDISVTSQSDDSADTVTALRVRALNDAANQVTDQLISLDNEETGAVVTTGILFGNTGTITTAIDASASNIGSALITGANDLSGTAWSITGSSGAAVFVGVNSGSGLLQGTGGLTITGTTSINASGSTATNIGTGSYSGNIAIGNASTGTLSLQGSTATITSTGGGNDITLTSADQIILNAGTTIEAQDQLLFNGVTTDITTTSDENLTIAPAGAGNIVLNADANSNIQVVATGSPTTALFTVSNSGQGTTTTLVDGFDLTFVQTATAGARDNAAFYIGTTSGSSEASDLLQGIYIGNLSSAGSGVESAIKIGTSWDRELEFVDTTPLITIGDTGTLTVSDGSNTLLALTDSSNTGNLAVTGILQAGSSSTVAYSRLGTGTTGHSLDAANDLLISDDLEVDGDGFFDGNLTVTGSCTGCGGGGSLQAAYTGGNSIEIASNTAVVITETNHTTSGDLLQLTMNPTTGGSASGDGLQITHDAVDANGATGHALHVIIDASQTTGNAILVEEQDASTLLFQVTDNGAITVGAAGAETTAITVTDTDFTNALSIADNNITGTTFNLIGTTAAIDFTNFDISSAGAATFSGVTTDITTASGEDLTLVAAGSGVIALSDTVNITANTLQGTTAVIDFTNFDVSSAGVITLAGAQTSDITTAAAATATALTFKPGTSSGASSNGPATTISGGDGSGTTSVTGGALTLQGGSATGGSGTRNGGNVVIEPGTGATANGAINIGSTNAGAINIGAAATAKTIAIGSTAGDVINIGVAATTAKTIAIGTGAVANTITIGSTSSTGVSITDDNWNITAAGAANFASIGAVTAGTGAFTTLSSTSTSNIGSGTGVVTINSSAALNLTGAAASTFVFPANTNNALQVTNGSNAFLTLNTTLNATGAFGLTIAPGAGPSFAAASGSQYVTSQFSPGTYTFTGTTNITGTGTASPAGSLFNQLSIAGTGTHTITEASNLIVNGAVVSSSSSGTQTLTSSYGLNILAGSALNGTNGAVTNGYGLNVNAPTGATNNYAAQFLSGGASLTISNLTGFARPQISGNDNLYLGGAIQSLFFADSLKGISSPGSDAARIFGSGGVQIADNGGTLWATFGTTGLLTLTPEVSTSGSPTLLALTGPAHTTLTASTEAIDVNLNLARTVQFSTGALTTQRAAVIQAPSYGFAGASTLTNAATLAITGAPKSQTNATITNSHGLLIQAGAVQPAGAVTNAYGLTVNTPTGATNNYATALLGAEADDAVLMLDADEGDDTGDTWFIKALAADNNSFSLMNEATEVLHVTTAGALQVDGALQVGATTNLAYSRLGTGTTNQSLDASDDLLISDDLEVNGDGFFDGNLTVTGTCTGCGGGSSALSGITAAAADDTDNDNTNYQIAWNWSSPTTQNALRLTNSGTGLTSGSIFGVSTASTGAISNGVVQLSASGAYTGTGGVLNVAATASTAGTLVNFTNNTASYTGNLIVQSATGLTTGFMEASTLGTTLTTGGYLNLTGASYNHASGQTGNLINIAFTEGTTTAGAVTSTTNGLLITPTINTTTSSSGVKTINGIKVGAPTLTNCTGGATCTYTGLNVDTTGTLASTTIYSALFNGGNVGIGTTAPGSILHVQQGSDSTSTSAPIALDVNSAGATGELTASSGTQTFARIAPTINQTSSAGYDALVIDVTETATGTGEKYLADVRVGGLSKTTVRNDGSIGLQDASNIVTPIGSIGRFQNLLIRSEEFDVSATWVQNVDARVSVPSTARTAPDGSTTADEVQIEANAATDEIYQNSGIAAASKTVTASVWLKYTSNTTVRIGLRGTGGTPESANQTISITTGWERYSFTKTFTGSATGNIEFFIDDAASSSQINFYAWGAQLEESSNSNSYAKTVGGALTNVNRGSLIESNVTAVAGTLYGGRHITHVTGAAVASSSQIGQLFRVIDDTSSGVNSTTVRALEVQGYSGSNIKGINTGVASFAYTFGVHAETTGQANEQALPAAVFADLNGTSGNAIRAFSNNVTSSDLVQFYQDTSAFTGNGLLMNFASTGSFSGNYIDLQKAGTSRFTIDDTGAIAILNIPDADNEIAIEIDSEESTGTQDLFRLVTDTATNDTEKFRIESSGAIFVSLPGTQTTRAVCHTNSGTSTTSTEELVDCDPSAGADFAEMYPVENGIDVGDVVALGTGLVNTYNQDSGGTADWNSVKGQINKLTKATTAYQSNLVGIVSDNYTDFGSTGYNIKAQDNPKSIALAGRVLVKISDENGVVHAGDYVTSSATRPGYAMRSTKPGMVLGQALADHDGSGKMMVFVQTFYFDPGVSIDENGNVSLQRGQGSTTVTTATTEAAAYLIKQESTGNILQLQNNDANRLLVANNGSLSLNADTQDDKELILSVKRTDSDAFTINARGDVHIFGSIIIKDDTFAGSIVTDKKGTAEVRFSYDLGSGKPVVQLTPESGTPTFAQITSWIKDETGNYIGFNLSTYGLSGKAIRAIVHYTVTAKQDEYETNGTDVLKISSEPYGASEKIFVYSIIAGEQIEETEQRGTENGGEPTSQISNEQAPIENGTELVPNTTDEETTADTSEPETALPISSEPSQ